MVNNLVKGASVRTLSSHCDRLRASSFKAPIDRSITWLMSVC